MSITAGHQKMIRHLIGMTTTANIVLPNGPGAGLPRYVVQVAGGLQQTRTIDGVTQAQPELVVSVETEAGAYTTRSDEMIEALVQRFAANTRFEGMMVRGGSLPPPTPSRDGWGSLGSGGYPGLH
jgi:hypothetical protein